MNALNLISSSWNHYFNRLPNQSHSAVRPAFQVDSMPHGSVPNTDTDIETLAFQKQRSPIQPTPRDSDTFGARFRQAFYSSTSQITAKPTFMPAFSTACMAPDPAVALTASAVITFSSLDFLKKHPVVMYPLEILVTLPLLAPIVSSYTSQYIYENLPPSTLTDLVIKSNELVPFTPPSAYNMAALCAIGVWGAFMNMGLSAFGDFAHTVCPGFKTPRCASEYTSAERQDWSPLRRNAHILLHGGTNSLSAISTEQFTIPFTDYPVKIVPNVDGNLFDINSFVRAYGQMIESFHDMLPNGLKFFASALPSTAGSAVTFLNGALGSVSFYGLYELLIGTHDEGDIRLMILFSLALAPLTYNLTAALHKQQTYDKSYMDVGLYGAINMADGIFAGANYTQGFKSVLNFFIRTVIIGYLARQVYHQSKSADARLPASI